MRLGTPAIETCEHRNVLVDYDHPFSTLYGVSVSELRASDPATTRPIMELLNPRCATCGATLSRRSLRSRVRRGGDLYDPRFRWDFRHPPHNPPMQRTGRNGILDHVRRLWAGR